MLVIHVILKIPDLKVMRLVQYAWNFHIKKQRSIPHGPFGLSHLSAPVSPRGLPVEIRGLSWSPKRWMNLRGSPGTWIPFGNRLGSVRAFVKFEPQMIFSSVSCMGWKLDIWMTRSSGFWYFAHTFLMGFIGTGQGIYLRYLKVSCVSPLAQVVFTTSGSNLEILRILRFARLARRLGG